MEGLQLFHALKGKSPLSFPASAGIALDTCQRLIFIPAAPMACPAGWTPFEGVSAYTFLLRVACGLESEIKGETNVFGQLKEAWAKALNSGNRTALGNLPTWLPRIFEDAKEIRTHHLQGLGQQSYGALVGKWIASQTLSRVLLIGAGNLAQSIHPYLTRYELAVWNRSEFGLRWKPSCPTYWGEDQELKCWEQADAIVICVPEDLGRDSLRKTWAMGRPVLHLGVLQEGHPHFLTLRDLFRMQQPCSELRDLQMRRAALACQEKAKLRAMGGSISIPHGWEDLAAFAR